MLKHVSIQVIFPFVAEGAVFNRANKESLQSKQEYGLRTKYFHAGLFVGVLDDSTN
jgi:hypothetical protein